MSERPASIYEESNILRQTFIDALLLSVLSMALSHTITRLRFENVPEEGERFAYTAFTWIGSITYLLLFYRLLIRAFKDKMVRRLDLENMQVLETIEVGEEVKIETKPVKRKRRRPARRVSRRKPRAARSYNG